MVQPIGPVMQCTTFYCAVLRVVYICTFKLSIAQKHDFFQFQMQLSRLAEWKEKQVAQF